MTTVEISIINRFEYVPKPENIYSFIYGLFSWFDWYSENGNNFKGVYNKDKKKSILFDTIPIVQKGFNYRDIESEYDPTSAVLTLSQKEVDLLNKSYVEDEILKTYRDFHEKLSKYWLFEQFQNKFQAADFLKNNLHPLLFSNEVDLLDKYITGIDNLNIARFRDIANTQLKLITNDIEQKINYVYPDFQTKDYLKIKADKELLKYIKPESISRFHKFEIELRERNYLDEEFNWVNKKINLICFFIYCLKQEILKPAYKENDFLKHLEERYNFAVGDQGKPNSYKKITPVKYNSEFFFLSNII
jgi:hypothetical protein